MFLKDPKDSSALFLIEKRSELLQKRRKRGAIESSHGDERLVNVGSK
jgi:aminoglycoside phosphotransferase family enzyme